jgi:hypothetical protein
MLGMRMLLDRKGGREGEQAYLDGLHVVIGLD